MNGEEFNRLYDEVQAIRSHQETIAKLIGDISAPIARLQVVVEKHEETLGKHDERISKANDWLNMVKGAVAVIGCGFLATVIAAILGRLL